MNIIAVSQNASVNLPQTFLRRPNPRVHVQDRDNMRLRRQAGDEPSVPRLQVLCLNRVFQARGGQFCEATVVGIRTALNMLTSSGVEELAPSWLSRVPAEVFAGLKGGFYTGLSLLQWQALRGAQIGQIPVRALFGGQQEPIVFEQIPIEFIARMLPRQIPGLTGEQLRNLVSRVDVLRLWDSAQLRALTREQRQIVGEQAFETALAESEQVPRVGWQWTPAMIASQRENFFNRISEDEWRSSVLLRLISAVEGRVIARLYPSTIANIPPRLIGELTPTQISMLGIEFYRALSFWQRGAIRNTQIMAIPGPVLAQFGPNELASLRSEHISALSNLQIAHLPEGFYNSMRLEQLQAFTPTQREAMSQQVRKLLDQRRLRISLEGDSVRSLTPEEMASRDAAWFNSLDIEVLRQFNPRQIASIPANALTGLNDVTRHHLLFYPANDGVRQIRLVPPDTIAALGVRFWRRLSTDSFQYFSIEQMSSINPENIGWLRAGDVEHYIRSAYYGFMRNEGREVRISALPPQLIRNLSLDVWGSSLNRRWFRSLTHEQISVLTAEQLIETGRAVPLYGHIPWRRAFLARIESRELQRLTREYLREGGYDVVPYHLLSSAQRAWVSEDAPVIAREGNRNLELRARLHDRMATRSLADLRNLPLGVWEALAPEDIRALPLHVIVNKIFWKAFIDDLQCVDQSHVQISACLHLLRYLSAEQWRALPERILKGVTDYFRNLPASVIPNIPPVAFSSCTSFQVYDWPLSMIAALTAEQVAHLFPGVFSTLGYSQIRALSPNALRLLNPSQTSAMTQPPPLFGFPPAVQGPIAALSIEQLNAIRPQALGVQFLEQLTPGQLRGLRPDRIASILPTVFGQLSIRTLAGILDLEVDGQGNAGFMETPLPQTERFEIVVPLLTPAQVNLLSGRSNLLRIGQFFLSCSLEAFGAIPEYAFGYRSSEFFRYRLSDERVAALRPRQVRHIRSEAFAALGARLHLLAPEVLREVRSRQLNALNEEDIRRLTAAQIREIPVETLRNLGGEGASRFYRSLSDEQREALTTEQRAFFRDLIKGVPIERAGRRDSPPPSGGGGRGGSPGGSQGDNSGSGGGASSGGGARPKDRNFLLKVRRSFGIGGNKTHQVAFIISPKDVPEEAAEYFKPLPFKPRYSSIDDPDSPGDNWPEYQPAVQGLAKDVLRAIPVSEIPKFQPKFFEYLQAKQVVEMSGQQKDAIPQSFIKVEPIINQKFGFGSGFLTYKQYQDKLDLLTRSEIQNRLSVEEIRQLAQDPKSYLLYLLKPDQLFDHPQKVAAMGEDVQSLWSERYYNALSLTQLTGVSPQVIKEMKPELVAKLEKPFFDGSFYNHYEDKQNYRIRMRALSQEQIDALGQQKIAQLGPEFFEALTPQQISLLRLETLQAISKEVLEKLSGHFFDALSPDQKKDLFSNKEVIPIIAKKILVLKTMEGRGPLRTLLENFEDWQVQAIPVNDIKTLSGSLFSAKLLGKLSQEQAEGLDGEQLNLMASELKNADGKWISYLTSLQVSQLQAAFVIALGDRIGILGKKVMDLNPGQFQNKEVVGVLFSELPEEGLYLLKSEQLERIRISEMPAAAFGRACREGGVKFLRQFKPSQIEQFTATQRGAIPTAVYGQLIWEIYEKKTDAQVAEDAVGVTPAAFRKALLDYGARHTDIFTDREMQKILQGTYRLKIEKAVGSSVQTLVSTGGMGYCSAIDSPELLVPAPGTGTLPGNLSQQTTLRV